MSNIERRVVGLETTELRVRRSEDGDGPTAIEGTAAVFNSESDDLGGFREVIEPGAFGDALERSDVRVLFNHDPDHVLGRVAAGTAEVRETDEGLEFRAELPDTTLGRDLAESIERGDISGNSFAFTVKEDGDDFDEDRDPPLRIIKPNGVRELFDVGPVTFPAYPATSVSTRAKHRAAEIAEERERENEDDRPLTDIDLKRKRLEHERKKAGV